jgi:hypothetical protein
LLKHGAAAHRSTFHLAKELSMTSLRQRFIEDMQVRNFLPVTQASYTREVSGFVRYFNKSPELLGPEQIRSYQVYLTNERKLGVVSISVATSALRLYMEGQTRGRTDSLIIEHRMRGLELLLFYREDKFEYEHASFRFEGVFKYISHQGSQPTKFHLARS